MVLLERGDAREELGRVDPALMTDDVVHPKGIFTSTADIKIKNQVMRSAMVFGAKKFDAFIVLTNGNIKDWKGVDCMVIPNPSPFNTKGVDFVKSDSKTVIAVGSQSYNKGYDLLFLIWKIVHQVYPDWQLKIYGKENLALNLQEKISSLNLQKSVFLKQPISKIENAYKSAAIYVMPSRSEGFGMVLISLKIILKFYC